MLNGFNENVFYYLELHLQYYSYDIIIFPTSTRNISDDVKMFCIINYACKYSFLQKLLAQSLKRRKYSLYFLDKEVLENVFADNVIH